MEAVEDEPLEFDIEPAERRYRAGERGLETTERRMLVSTRMRRLLDKAEEHFHLANLLQPPVFVPVYRNKRMTGTYRGYFCQDHIKLAHYIGITKVARYVLWHEVLHGVVYMIRDTIYAIRGKPESFTEQEHIYNQILKWIYAVGEGNGSHNSWKWKITCQCGNWWKSMNRKKWMLCHRCHKYAVSPTEFKRKKKMGKASSYQAWKSNRQIL